MCMCVCVNERNYLLLSLDYTVFLFENTAFPVFLFLITQILRFVFVLRFESCILTEN